MNIVSSFFEGRVRFRADIFKNKEISCAVTSLLKNIKGIENFQLNPVTGSLLVEYDPVKLPLLKLKQALPTLEKLKELYEDGAEQSELFPLIDKLKKIFD